MLGGSAKRGSGLPASASASNSANVCPDPMKRKSACAGLNVTVSLGDLASCSDGSASHIPGCEAASDIRDHGMSMDFGLGILITPTAPDSSTVFQNSCDARACDFSAPEMFEGPPLMYTST